jgi:hypothetical protein
VTHPNDEPCPEAQSSLPLFDAALLAAIQEDEDEFAAYLKACTDNQVRGVYEKEVSAGRPDYAKLAKAEAERRGVDL